MPVKRVKRVPRQSIEERQRNATFWTLAKELQAGTLEVRAIEVSLRFAFSATLKAWLLLPRYENRRAKLALFSDSATVGVLTFGVCNR